MQPSGSEASRQRGATPAVLLGCVTLPAMLYLLASGPVARFAGPPEWRGKFSRPPVNAYTTLYDPLFRALKPIPPLRRLMREYVDWWCPDIGGASGPFGEVRDALE